MTKEEKQEIRSSLNVKKSKLTDLERLKFDDSEVIQNRLKQNLREEIISLEAKLKADK